MPASDKLAFFFSIVTENSNWHTFRLNKIKLTIKKILTMALKIQPLSDRVLLEPQEAETKTASGLYIPDSAKEKPQQGKVVAVGKGKKDHNMTVKVGDIVLYGKYSGSELKYEGNDYLIMREEDILAII
tara:strand:+ start:129 stop:515 length:387 start_codon:yes stop_codon:yes gene_type:complete